MSLVLHLHGEPGHLLHVSTYVNSVSLVLRFHGHLLHVRRTPHTAKQADLLAGWLADLLADWLIDWLAG